MAIDSEKVSMDMNTLCGAYPILADKDVEPALREAALLVVNVIRSEYSPSVTVGDLRA